MEKEKPTAALDALLKRKEEDSVVAEAGAGGLAGGLERSAGWLEVWVHPISRYLVYGAAVLVLCMAVLIVVDVTLTMLFQSPIIGVIEFETYMLALLCFFGLGYAMIHNAHVAVDLFYSGFSAKTRMFLGVVFPVLGGFAFALVSWEYVLRALDSARIGETGGVTSIPSWPFFVATAVGCALLALVLLSNWLRALAGMVKAKLGARALVALAAAVLFLCVPALLRALSVDLDPTVFGLLMMGVMLFLLFIGFPVAFAMALIGILGTWYLAGAQTALGVIQMAAYDSVATFHFAVIPFFVCMGFLCLNAGIGKHLYASAQKWFGQMPGGLAIGTIFGCGGFAAICGDSMSTAATMGSVALPEMKKYRYDDALATGSVAAGGTLGILIPPSVGFIAYAIVTEESVGKLFMAGLIPGALLAILFGLCVYLQCKRKPSLGPKAPSCSFAEKFGSLRRLWSVLALFLLVVGGIYLGFFTPTEAGGVGVVGALVVAVLLGEFSWKKFTDTLLMTAQITAMVAAILIGVTMLGYFVTLAEIPMKLADFVAGLQVSRYIVLSLVLLLYAVLGMVMNIIPMVMLTMPIIFPTVTALGFDPIWFGVITVIMMEMGQISPPVGINVFVIAGVAPDVPMIKIFKGILPFIAVQVLMIVILTLFPDIAMYLPNAMDVLPSIGD